jgi:hypothetical protein
MKNKRRSFVMTFGGTYLNNSETIKASTAIKDDERRILMFDDIKLDGLPEQPFKIMIECEEGDIVKAYITYGRDEEIFQEVFYLHSLSFKACLKEDSTSKEEERKQYFVKNARENET